MIDSVNVEFVSEYKNIQKHPCIDNEYQYICLPRGWISSEDYPVPKDREILVVLCGRRYLAKWNEMDSCFWLSYENGYDYYFPLACEHEPYMSHWRIPVERLIE